jgi:heme A synthase
MKIILALFNIVFLVVLITAPALKKINLIRLLTVVLLLIYSIGIIKMIFLFPISSAVSLGAGTLAVLCMALLFRQRLVRSEMKDADPKIRMLSDRRNDLRIKNKGLEVVNRLAVKNI